MSAACFLAKERHNVTVLEKHNIPGGRARQLQAAGFSFDMGPSWYWMPDIFERFFNCFGKTASDYYALQRLDPSYRIYWKNDATDIPADYNALKKVFDTIEPGSAKKLDKFLEEAAYKYKVGINKLVFKPGLSVSEFIDADLLKGIFRLDVFQSMKKHVGKFFRHPYLQQLMEFPVLFLGAMPEKIPALYSLMNFADIKGGTWFPAGGIYSIVQAMHALAEENGAAFQFNEDVTEIILKGSRATAVKTSSGNLYEADAVLGAADYHFIETKLLPPAYRTYSDDYWNSRIMAPSCLLYYVGINKKLKNVLHHSLFFDTSFEQHGKEIYETKQWPQEPLFYVSATSVTDDSTAPAGCENLFFLIPAAAGLTNDSEELREHFFQLIVKRFEERTGEKISDSIIFKKSFAHSDFINEYNAFKGNAYGLANTLLQTAILKPKCRSKKVKNLFFAGQLTVPGPGVPPSIISGEVAAKQIQKLFA